MDDMVSASTRTAEQGYKSDLRLGKVADLRHLSQRQSKLHDHKPLSIKKLRYDLD
jgi:hypothetical protein